MENGDHKNGDTYKYMSPWSPFSRAKPGYEASRLAGPASGRRNEYPERSGGSPDDDPPKPLRGHLSGEIDIPRRLA